MIMAAAHSEHGKLQPKKSWTLFASAVDASELRFRTTLPCVSGEGQTKVYFTSPRYLVSAWKARADSVVSLMVAELWFRGPNHGVRRRHRGSSQLQYSSRVLATSVNTIA